MSGQSFKCHVGAFPWLGRIHKPLFNCNSKLSNDHISPPELISFLDHLCSPSLCPMPARTVCLCPQGSPCFIRSCLASTASPYSSPAQYQQGSKEGAWPYSPSRNHSCKCHVSSYFTLFVSIHIPNFPTSHFPNLWISASWSIFSAPRSHCVSYTHTAHSSLKSWRIISC